MKQIWLVMMLISKTISGFYEVEKNIMVRRTNSNVNLDKLNLIKISDDGIIIALSKKGFSPSYIQNDAVYFPDTKELRRLLKEGGIEVEN